MGKPFRFGPVALSTTTTADILNPPTVTGGVNAGSSPCYIILTHVWIGNTTNSPIDAAVWLGATGTNASGTESMFPGTAAAGTLSTGQSVPANDVLHYYGFLRLEATEFLVGGAAQPGLTIQGEGEIGIA